MSLVSLLLEPISFPLEHFVAYRNDSIKGSGTRNDPWNAATKWEAPLVLSSLTYGGLEATGTLQSGSFQQA